MRAAKEKQAAVASVQLGGSMRVAVEGGWSPSVTCSGPDFALTSVLASSLAKRAPGYTSLGFPDPRKLPYTPSADTAR
jgi:hypothetical protein